MNFFRFKLEEKTRYVDRLTDVEFREARVKGLNDRLFLLLASVVFGSLAAVFMCCNSVLD